MGQEACTIYSFSYNPSSVHIEKKRKSQTRILETYKALTSAFVNFEVNVKEPVDVVL